MSEKTSLALHALLLAASVATVLLVTASLVPQARGVQLSTNRAQLASVQLPVIFAGNYLVKDESRVPLRD